MAKRKKLKEDKSVVFAGGHGGTAALALIREVQNRGIPWDIHWIGPERSVEGKKAKTIESKVFPKYGVVFHKIVAGKIQRKWSPHTIPSLLKVPLGFLYAIKLLLSIKPLFVLSFGGYAAVPVVIVAWFLQIPVYVQEQIAGLGFANRRSVPFAKKVFLAREDGLKFTKGKGIVTGLPINPDVSSIQSKKLHKDKTIFVFPGSRGSQIVNDAVEKSLDRLLEKYNVVHQTGELDFKKFEDIRASLNEDKKSKYEIHPFIDYDYVGRYYKDSDIVVGRAGANTVAEIMACGIPSVLIPLTWTNYKEQVKNAKIAEDAGIAKVLPQNKLSKNTLLKAINYVEDNWKDMSLSVQNNSIATMDKQAAKQTVDIIMEEVK